MIGTIRHEVKIDYTGVSTPLTASDVYVDLQHTEAVHNGGEVSAFVMWEHQWDHMIKRADLDDENSSYVADQDGRWLWGIRVELADEAKPIAVLEVRHEMTEEEAEEIRAKFAALALPSWSQYLRDEQAKIVERAKAKC